MWNPFGNKQYVEERSAVISVSDPAVIELLGLSGMNDANMPVTPSRALGLTAVYRAVSLISGVVAGLPLKTYTRNGNLREQVSSFLDDPAMVDDQTPFEFMEFAMVSLLLHGNAYLLKRYNFGGEVVGLIPLAPQAVSVDISDDGVKTFRVSLANGSQRIYGTDAIVHIRAMSTDGVCGLSPITVARQSLGIGLASDKVAARQFSSGLLMGGIVTPADDITQDEGKALKEGLQAKVSGHDNAGEIIVVNRNMKFSPWTMNAKDAQFIESRVFQVEEIARIFGLPVILLADATKTTSWGAGVREVIQATQRFTFKAWTDRIQERLTRVLPQGLYCEFDYAGLLEGSREDVTANLAAEIAAGLLTPDEGRAILNRPPLPKGDDAA